MRLHLVRYLFNEHYTTGKLSIDGVFECYTLEDCVRPPHRKVPGVTAIQAGTYRVMVNWSSRFNRMMPLLLSVPEFTGVRIHWGNRATDTEGCILVGARIESPGVLALSRAAFDQLFDKIELAYTRNDAIKIEITDQREADPVPQKEHTA